MSHAGKITNMFSRVSSFSRRSRSLTFPSAIPSIIPSSRQGWITSLILSGDLEVTKIVIHRKPEKCLSSYSLFVELAYNFVTFLENKIISIRSKHDFFCTGLFPL